MATRKVPVHKKVLIVLLVTFVIINIIFGSIIFYQEVIYEEELKDALLTVDEVYFLLEESTDGKIHLSVIAFISNEGEMDCQARIRAFAIDADSNLAMDDAVENVGKVPAGKTVEASLEMELDYNGSFRIELMVFKDDMITVKGYGTVNLAYHGFGGSDYYNTETDPTEEGEEKASAPFPAVGTVAVISVLAALIIGYRKRRRWSS